MREIENYLISDIFSAYAFTVEFNSKTEFVAM